MATAIAPAPATSAAPPRRDDPLYEVVNGQRVELPPMSIYANLIAKRLLLNLEEVQAGALGTATMEALLVLDEVADLRRRPDVAFISVERWPLDRELPEAGDWVVVPDLAVEVTSPNDLFAEVLAKVHEYFDQGVRQVWIVSPEEEQVYVYRTPTAVQVLTADQTLASELLPGLAIPLTELFRRSASAVL
jgi:Uma2 family endonuclease